MSLGMTQGSLLPAAVGGGAITWTKTGNPAIQNIAFGSTSATFSSVPIGTASSDRIVVVVIGQDQGDSGDPTGITIGGTSATKAVGETHNTSSIWYANIATGTTANIVVTCSFNLGVIGICVGVFTGITATPTATSSTAYGFGGSPINVTVTVPSGGWGISGGFTLADSGVTVTGSTLDYNTTGSGDAVFMAEINTSGSQTAHYTTTPDFQGTSCVMAAWGA